MKSQEMENVSTLNSGSKAMTNDLNSSTKLPLINDTLRGQGNGTVIIIKPLDNVKELINNPVEIIKATNNSFFNCPEVKEIRVNKRKNILVAEMRENNPTVLKQLLEVNMLGKCAVNCYQVPTKR